MQTLTTSSLTSWSEFVPQDWVQESRSLHEQGLVVTYDLQAASEFDNSGGCDAHLLIVNCNHNLRQIHRFDGREYDTANTPGSLFLLPAAMPSFHYWECDRADEAVAFYLNPQRLQQFAAENDVWQPDRLELRPILFARDPQIEAIATAFRGELLNCQLGGKLYTESLATLFLVHLLRHYCTQPLTLRTDDCGLSRQQLQYAIDFIQAHLSAEFKLQDIAESLGLSQYYFCRLFKQSMGIAPYQYVLQQRVELVKRLLVIQPATSLVEVALLSGFSSQSQMTQHFRKWAGTTPHAYRRACRT